ncbi:DUF5809 family protein [Halohasta salina]|uniref:DUF5809 family protein n=1 Tax=Halohasta salina TaxID=2961621 RepID=UPI0020A3E12E|nr:DUF5809 family protein [Halohasta salina]
METAGVYEFESVDAAREAYEAAGPAAQVVIKEATKAMAFDNAEYDERVTGAVIETARDAMFASLLTTYDGSRGDFDEWCDDNPDYSVDLAGSESVASVVWHPVGFAETVVAASYQHEPEAAAATVRRRAFGRHYRGEVGDT